MNTEPKSVITEAFKCTFRMMVQKWKIARPEFAGSEMITHDHILLSSNSFLRRILKILETHLKEERDSFESPSQTDPDSRFIQNLEKCETLSQQVLNELQNSGKDLNDEEMEIFTLVFRDAMKEIKTCPTAPVTH